MRAAVRTFAQVLRWSVVATSGTFALATLLSATACLPDKYKKAEFLEAPKSYDPAADDLTFGKKNLDAFNAMSSSERQAHVESMTGKAGTYKGQAIFEVETELGENISDRELGKYEAAVQVKDPVLYEITIDYLLYSNDEMAKGLPKGTHVSFTGTLANLEYRDEAKPRKLVVKLKDVTLERVED